MGKLQRIFKIEPGLSFWQAIADYAAGKWIEILTIFVAGGGMTYLAALTSWITPWGPIAYGAIGVFTVIVIALAWAAGSLIRSKARANRARAELEIILSKEPDKLNPLEKQFERKIIRPNDLFIPYNPVLEARQFLDCNFVGPGVFVFLDRCEIMNDNFMDCNLVVLNGAKPHKVMGTVGFKSCRFQRCKFVNMTILVPSNLVPAWEKGLGAKISWLGYEVPQSAAPQGALAVP